MRPVIFINCIHISVEIQKRISYCYSLYVEIHFTLDNELSKLRYIMTSITLPHYIKISILVFWELGKPALQENQTVSGRDFIIQCFIKWQIERVRESNTCR